MNTSNACIPPIDHGTDADADQKRRAGSKGAGDRAAPLMRLAAGEFAEPDDRAAGIAAAPAAAPGAAVQAAPRKTYSADQLAMMRLARGEFSTRD